jgi:FkbM family methyltransferase
VLRGVPGSKLLLKAGPLGDEAGRKRVIEAFGAQKIGPERLVLEGRTAGTRDHLAMYGRVDIALDPFPYNGTTTTCEALWMGVPVVALAGDRHSARVGASLLTAIGMTELLARDVKGYVAAATALAKDRARLAETRRTLRARMAGSPLCDARRLAREIERAYRAMWRAHCAKAPVGAAAPAAMARRQEVVGTEWVEMRGALKVAVPASLELITPYVLREQRDWFEPEIGFVRALLEPGQRVIDVGANHGVYALTAARLVGPAGRVWAFEPEPETAARLRASANENGLAWLEVHEVALSSRDGEATLHAHESSELSSLDAGAVEGGRASKVKVKALAGLARDLGIERVDFVKLDAEGEEERIVEGATSLLARTEPLVMFEIKHGDRVNLGLLDRLGKLGFGPYRLIEGLNALVPFDRAKPLDPSQLNLFACSSARAAKLEKAGLLAPSVPARAALPEVDPRLWETLLDGTAYARRMRDRWRGTGSRPGRVELDRALSLYALAHLYGRRDIGRSYAALAASFDDLLESAGHEDRLPRLLSIARVAAELGERSFAVRVLGDVLAKLERGQDVELDEPFLAPAPRFDAVAIKGEAAAWCLAAAVEQHERLRAFSGFFRGPACVERLRLVERLGYGDEEMARRLEVAGKRWGEGSPPG